MANPIAEQLISDLTFQKVSQGSMFTAFDISLFAKQEKGMTERHNAVKHVVHDLYVNGQMPGYERTLIDIPGVSRQAFLYHPIGADISRYDPKDRSKFPNVGGSAAATSNGISVVNPNPIPAPTVTSTTGTQLGQRVDRRGRLCIPNILTRKLGWNGMRAIVVYADNGGVVLTENFRSYACLTSYYPDKDDNIRISARTLRKCGIACNNPQTDRYSIQINGSDIEIHRA